MKKALIIISICTLFITGCINNKQNNTKESKDIMSDIKVIINEKIYTIKLENNKTVEEFIELLPQEYTMNELNGNEKYVYLDKSLTTKSYNPKHIEQGDVMLFDTSCLVIFYKSFDTTYSYTKIGHIDNLDNLENGNIKVKFEK